MARVYRESGPASQHVKIISSPEPYPSPGRPVRSIVARCLTALYTRGETKTLYDTIQSFLKIIGEPKGVGKDSSKIAAMYCVAELMGMFGSQVMSLVIEIVTTCLKLYRTSSVPIILKYHSLGALEKTLSTAKRAVTDALVKDITKQMKNALSDKALPLQRAACDVLILMYPADDSSRLVSDVDPLVVSCTKSLENADQLTRRSLAKLVAHILATTQVQRVIPVAEPPKKAKKGQNANEDDEDAIPGMHVQAEEAKPIMTPQEMLAQLSTQFNKPQASKKTRVGIFDFYAALFAHLGSGWVEANYGLLVGHLMTEIVANPRNSTTRYETLLVRALVEVLLRDLVGVRMLGEQAQISAIQELSTVYLKRWPALMPGQTAPNPLCLAVALREVAGLLQQLGNAPPPVQDALVEPLQTLLGHPNHTIRVNASWALRCFCYSTPLRLPKVLLSVVEMLQRDISTLTTPAAPADITTRTLGHAYGLAALLAVIPERPLYVSYDITPERAGEHEVRVARTEVEVAWTCIAALMALGPNFVRAHLPQLLVLWRNALPKPTSKDAQAGRSPAEWMFLLHLRESALGAVYCFLKYNSPTLVTPDVTRRIASMLSNSLSFANTFTSRRVEETPEMPQPETKELSIFLCFSLIGHSGATESIQSSLLQSAIALFANGYAYGVSDVEIEERLRPCMNRDSVEVSIEELSDTKPILRSCSHDPLFLCQRVTTDTASQWPEPPPPATAAVNAADLSVTVRSLTQLIDFTGSAKLEKNSGRRAAVSLNVTIALVLALRQVTGARSRQVLGSPQVTSLLAPRAEAIGRLANIAGTNFLTNQAKTLVDQVVSNRDPHGRAGCALAFGEIHAHVGDHRACPHVLINDPHPVVHFWALTALARVIDAASLAYAPFVPSTLGLLFKVYMMESHEPEGGALNQANVSGDLPAYQVVCQNIDAVITVLGPDIQDSARSRTLVLDLVHQFNSEDDDGICVEAINCIQHFLMFAPDSVNVPDLVVRFRGYLSSSRRPLKLASINALYQLVQKDAFAMSRLGGDQLVEELFAMLDDDSSVDGVRNVITSWLQQTVIHNPSAWIDLCQRIMSRTTASQQIADAASKKGDLMDDEGHQESGAASGRQTSRWRTQLFALQCLHSICNIVSSSGRREHLDMVFALSQGIPVRGLLVSRVPDLIKIAFTASAAHVMEIRLEGLTVLRDVIEMFARTPDPEYQDALLLEQHQAPVTAALTPAFSSDSTPEILATAIGACAVFVGCGVVKDVGRMGRILKLLTSALEQSKESGMLSLGEAAELSPNASVMLRIATLSAWAELQVASKSQKYLIDVVKPYRLVLAPLWIASLRDYASVRADTEVVEDAPPGAIDSSYTSLGKEVLLPYYVESWPVILQAMATAMEEDEPYIVAAMDGQEGVVAATGRESNDSMREEPAAFFFAVFGLVYEALCTAVPDADAAARRVCTIALQALTSLVCPKYCGKVFADPVLFEELVNLFYRMALTEPAVVQVYMVEAVASLAEGLAVVQRGTSIQELMSLPQVHCVRICAYVLRRAITGPRISAVVDGSTPLDKAKLINATFEAFVKISSSFGTRQREEFRAIGITLYGDLLKDETSEVDLVGPTLQSLKILLDKPADLVDTDNKYEKAIHGILSACLVNVDEMRGRQGVISTRKIKTNLLAAVLILTVIPPNVKVGRAILDHCCFLLSQKLSDADEASLTAAHCAKTLILASTSGNAVLRHCARLLLPGMVECLAKIAASVADDATDSQLAMADEIFKALTALLSSLPEELRSRALGVLMPAMILLLHPTRVIPSKMHTQSVRQLLAIAAVSPAAFKEATGKLNQQMRDTLETSVRQAVGNRGPAVDAPKPQISLRSF
ncbi:clathrin-coated vesicle protein [Fomitopsis serialis]|uniref:clathrin-coated vesicle protein n=1 Tax=Fomitopsis serialis TaxID=139415 RepID=UPI00200852A2|nr:clathrin-coated vesicle protein [Neoantrodia serialis]KAH9916212.1 clathrin-coated vesicle protein [Neoantrodia serialis]